MYTVPYKLLSSLYIVFVLCHSEIFTHVKTYGTKSGFYIYDGI